MKSIIYKNMLKANKTRFRPEQVLLYEILKVHLQPKEIAMEHLITYKTEFGDYGDATLDIYMLFHDQKYAIRLMGPVHDAKIRTRKDELQKAYLEKIGFKLIDIWYWNCPYLFKAGKKQLNFVEMSMAYKEVWPAFDEIGLPPNCDTIWLKNYFE